MSRCSSFVSKDFLILCKLSVVLVPDGLLFLAWITDNSLLVESFTSLDSLLCFVIVTIETELFCLCSDESLSNGDNRACFLELVFLRTGDNCFGLGRLTGEDKDARELCCSYCLYFFALLVLFCRFLKS